jgi:radical SAM protein with 4Fe4S-binding SPASM domain
LEYEERESLKDQYHKGGRRMALSTLIWLITGKCNFNCKYCYARRMRGLDELETEEALKGIEDACLLGVRHIAFTGGEPLLRKDIFSLLRHTTELGIRTSITTNGSLITEEVANSLRELDVFVYLSLNGVEEEHERFRGKGSWKRLLNTIKILKNIDVGFATVTTLHKENYKDIGKIMRFCATSGSLFSCFLPLMPFDKVGKELLLEPAEVLKVLKSVDNEVTRLKYKVSLWCMPFSKRFIRNRLIRVGRCRNGEVIDIGVNGDLLLCDVLDISLTTLREKSLKEAINRFEAHRLNQEISFPILRGKCARCKVSSVCKGGCYARAYKEFGSFNEKDPLCPA